LAERTPLFEFSSCIASIQVRHQTFPPLMTELTLPLSCKRLIIFSRTLPNFLCECSVVGFVSFASVCPSSSTLSPQMLTPASFPGSTDKQSQFPLHRGSTKAWVKFSIYLPQVYFIAYMVTYVTLWTQPRYSGLMLLSS
jgi:hypothetical protein